MRNGSVSKYSGQWTVAVGHVKERKWQWGRHVNRDEVGWGHLKIEEVNKGHVKGGEVGVLGIRQKR